MKWLYRLIWGNKEPKGPDKEIDEVVIEYMEANP
jgi:hypothetical protein